MGTSLAASVARRICADFIDSGVAKAGERLPGVRELEQRYKVSKATVAHAFGILEAQGLIRKRQGQGCFVTDLVQEQPRGGTQSLGLVLPSSMASNGTGSAGISPAETMMQVYGGVARACRRHGCHVVVGYSDWDYDTERQEVARLINDGCVAVVLYPTPRVHRQLRSDYLRTDFPHVPIVLVDMGYPEQKRSQVVFDNYTAGYEMTRLLIDEGHRRIAFMLAEVPHGELMHRSNWDRYQGYLAALKDAGLGHGPADRWILLLNTPAIVDDVADLVKAWKEQPDRPTAVIAFEDGCAIFAINAARELEVDVPGELRVAGFDNLSAGNAIRPPFPTTRPDFALASETAANLALRHVQGNLVDPVTYMLPAPILPRGLRHAAPAQASTDVPG